MYKPINFRTTGNEKVFFISDTHFGHDKDFVRVARGFSNIREHDEAIIKSWNSVVSSEDVVFHLGDFTVGAGANSVQFTKEIIWRLNGEIHYLWGNHNAGIKDVEFDNLKYKNKLIFHGMTDVIRIGKQVIVLGHYAQRIWFESDRGSWNLCGHSHGNDKESLPNYLGAKRLDVGWDVFRRPMSFEELKPIMDKKQIITIDHHC